MIGHWNVDKFKHQTEHQRKLHFARPVFIGEAEWVHYIQTRGVHSGGALLMVAHESHKSIIALSGDNITAFEVLSLF